MNKYELSFPPKILALLIAIVSISLTLALTFYFVYGRVTVTSPVKEAISYTKKDTQPRPLPFTYRLKPGRVPVFVKAPGYLTSQKVVTIIPFWHRKVTVDLRHDYSFENPHFKIEWQELKQSYLIVPVIEIPPQAAPEPEIAAQWTTYSKYADEALSYIHQQGGDPKSLPIEWWGQEWWPRGKSISVK